MKHHPNGQILPASLGVALCAIIVGAGFPETASAARVKSSVTAKINGSDGPITVPDGTVAYFSWTSTNVDACSITVKVNGDTIHQGPAPLSATDIATPAVRSPPITTLSYQITCTKGRTSVSDSVSVSPVADPTAFSNSQAVTITGYDGIAMEPFLSRDGQYLFFNNSNGPGGDTNIYYARRADSDTVFTFIGELPGVNNLNPDKPTSLEAAPTMTDTVPGTAYSEFYYTNLKDYDTTLVSTFVGKFNSDGTVSEVQPVNGLAPLQQQWVTMDVGVSPDGNTMYYSNAYFDPDMPDGSPPSQAIMNVAQYTSAAQFTEKADSDALLKRVNGDNGELNYAPNISEDGLELFFTRASTNPAGPPQLFVARRSSATDAFSTIQMIVAAGDFVEGPSMSADGKRIYYHKEVTAGAGDFKIYIATRP